MNIETLLDTIIEEAIAEEDKALQGDDIAPPKNIGTILYTIIENIIVLRCYCAANDDIAPPKNIGTLLYTVIEKAIAEGDKALQVFEDCTMA
ncbi:hypothetical protein RHMOL_Rhmol06G0153600 [Rhododendron molle]|uniref:Uncharacterized protein n=1 Tax=Rhododendron molle TaxID=49168 RepID=A0ACC0NCV7_RHOML|nr:hypothetical protein RHMOL_Rhmol06G0153600 [Rhododendron molle]